MNNLAGNIAATIMAGSEGGVCNIVANVDGSNNILSPTLTETSLTRATMVQNSAPNLDRKFVLDPITMALAILAELRAEPVKRHLEAVSRRRGLQRHRLYLDGRPDGDQARRGHFHRRLHPRSSQ